MIFNKALFVQIKIKHTLGKCLICIKYIISTKIYLQNEIEIFLRYNYTNSSCTFKHISIIKDAVLIFLN